MASIPAQPERPLSELVDEVEQVESQIAADRTVIAATMSAADAEAARRLLSELVRDEIAAALTDVRSRQDQVLQRLDQAPAEDLTPQFGQLAQTIVRRQETLEGHLLRNVRRMEEGLTARIDILIEHMQRAEAKRRAGLIPISLAAVLWGLGLALGFGAGLFLADDAGPLVERMSEQVPGVGQTG
jgi:hypothetical protein